MRKRTFILILSATISAVAMAQETVKLSVGNTLNKERKNVPVVISLKKYGEVKSANVMFSGESVAYQLDDLNKDGVFDELCFLVNLDKKETKDAVVTLYNTGEPAKSDPKVFAEMVLRNPKVKIKNKHDLYISELTANRGTYMYQTMHHHGVAFESEQVGYRVYFDNRQTIDMYGKTHERLEIKDTQFYPDEQQKAAGYGDDVMWSGDTYGLGAFRGWYDGKSQMLDDVEYRTQRIVAYGPLRTIVEMEDRNWVADPTKPAVNMTVQYILYAGHRDCEVHVKFNKNVAGYKFSTGIINVKNSTELSDKQGLRGCWGTDWPFGANNTEGSKLETIGLGINIPRQNIVSEEPAGENYGYVLQTNSDQIDYNITFGSDNEAFGFHNANSWFEYLKEWKTEVESPVEVRIL